MRHRIGFKKLGVKASHRKALKRNLVTSLFQHESMTTTRVRAKEVQGMAEKMITRAKVDSVSNRRHIARFIHDKEVVKKLFNDIAPLFKERNGGYTRILKLGQRQGDAADMVIFELVEKTAVQTKEQEDQKKAREKRATAKAAKKEAEEKEVQEAEAQNA